MAALTIALSVLFYEELELVAQSIETDLIETRAAISLQSLAGAGCLLH